MLLRPKALSRYVSPLIRARISPLRFPSVSDPHFFLNAMVCIYFNLFFNFIPNQVYSPFRNSSSNSRVWSRHYFEYVVHFSRSPVPNLKKIKTFWNKTFILKYFFFVRLLGSEFGKGALLELKKQLYNYTISLLICSEINSDVLVVLWFALSVGVAPLADKSFGEAPSCRWAVLIRPISTSWKVN